MMMRTILAFATLATVLGAAGCGRADSGHAGMEGAAADSQMGGMAGMPGMAAEGGSPVERLMQAVDSSLQRTADASPESLAAMLPAHRSALANLIAEMNAEMRAMSMTGDAAWNATVDSLRRDLVALAEMPPTELAGAMPAHGARAQRLMEMHRAMMRGMKM